MNSPHAARVLLFTSCMLLASACKTFEIGLERAPQTVASTVTVNKRIAVVSPRATPVSVLPTPILLPPSATPQPTDAPSATPTPALRKTLEPTLLPTLTSDELSPETVAQMATWHAAPNGAPYP